jgi:lambda family phage tail tape measure protein
MLDKSKELSKKKESDESKGAYDRMIEQLRRSIAVQEAETKAVDAGVAAHARLRIETQVVEGALRSKDITKQQADQLRNMTDATHGLTDAQISKMSPALQKVAKDMKLYGEQSAAAAQKLAEMNAQAGITFDRATMGMDQTEAKIASSMRSIYGSDWVKRMNSGLAVQMRINEQLRFTHDLGLDAFKGIVSDLRAGKTAAEAFQNAAMNMLGKVADKLAEMAFNQLWAAAFGGKSGGGLLGSLFGGGTGLSLTGTGGLYARGAAFSGGNVIHPFALGGIPSDILVKPTLFPMANGQAGLAGEAGPEAIMPLKRGADGRLGVASSGGGGMVVHMGGTTIQVNGSADSSTVQEMRMELERDRAERYSQFVKFYTDAKSRRHI